MTGGKRSRTNTLFAELISAVPSGLMPFESLPGTEVPGYYQMSLRDNGGSPFPKRLECHYPYLQNEELRMMNEDKAISDLRF